MARRLETASYVPGGALDLPSCIIDIHSMPSIKLISKQATCNQLEPVLVLHSTARVIRLSYLPRCVQCLHLRDT